MWEHLLKGLTVVLSRPMTWIGYAFFSILGFLPLAYFSSTFIDAAVDLLFSNIAGLAVLHWPAFLWTSFAGALVAFVLSVAWFLFLQIVAAYWVASYVSEIHARQTADAATVLARVLGAVPGLVLASLGLLFGVFGALVFGWLVVAFIDFPLLWVLLLALGLFLGLFLAIKYGFVVPALVVERAHLNEALKSSYRFSNRRFWSVAAFMILLWFLSQVVIGLFSTASLSLDDSLGEAIWLLGIALAGSWIAASQSFLFFEEPEHGADAKKTHGSPARHRLAHKEASA